MDEEEVPTLARTCEGCGRPDDRTDPLRPYMDGAHYHDQCADECGISEEEML